MSGTITRSTLRQQIADALRDEMLAGRLPAGYDFTVKEIAEQYGVSATPVREALFDLSAQGLLDADQHRGFRVHEFTYDDFLTMVEARALVVDGILRPGAECRVPARDSVCLASIRRRAEASRRAAELGELDVLIGYDLRFWRELGQFVGNPYVSDLLERIRIHCWVYSVPALRAQEDLRGVLWAGHLELFEAVERRDGAEARRLITAYNDHSVELLRKLSGGSAPGPPPA